MSEITNTSVVLSVSAGKGCYRHIRVSEADTLEELAEIILCAFEFDNDHAHAFFMSNRIWDDSDCYYMEGIGEGEGYRYTCDYTLQQIGLKRGDTFKFVFDFGYEWKFRCKVLRVEDVATESAELIKSVGEPPEQYPDYKE